jgi:hypothetical protein
MVRARVATLADNSQVANGTLVARGLVACWRPEPVPEPTLDPSGSIAGGPASERRSHEGQGVRDYPGDEADGD